MSIDPVRLLESLVAIPSLSHEETAAADCVQRTVESAGLICHRHGDNVWFELGDGEDGLLLNSHLDVVPASSNHPFDPFTPVINNGRLYGRGAVDAKASGAAMVASVLSLAAEGWTPASGRVVVALTTCEEMGGGYNGLQDTRPHLPEIHAAVVGEPTHLQPCVAQKGLLILRVEAHGKSAHAARPGEGQNAIELAASDIQRIADMTFGKIDPYLGPVTATVTVIEGGIARNVVPDLCKFWVDIRSTPVYSHPELIDLVRESLDGDVHIHSDRFHPVSTGSDSRVVTAACGAAQKLGHNSEPFGSPTMSDWIYLHDLPCVKLGPGDSNLSHTGDESILVSEVEDAVQVYREIIKGYFALN